MIFKLQTHKNNLMVKYASQDREVMLDVLCGNQDYQAAIQSWVWTDSETVQGPVVAQGWGQDDLLPPQHIIRHAIIFIQNG